jgi:alkylhydroperoxidase/carboxymuconolactone decarboxylase family protein YurZ
MTPPAPDLDRIRDHFVQERGYWRPWTETLLQANPPFVEQYARYAGHPARHGPLSHRLVELIYVALDASASHLYEAGLRTHMDKAMAAGATQADVFDVLHLVAVQGLASVAQAAEILWSHSSAEDTASIDPVLQARLERVGQAHGLTLDALARMDPAYTAVMLDWVEGGLTGSGLQPAERTLVQLALHACFTAFNPAAVRHLTTQGQAQGLNRADMLQAIQLGAHLAVHGTALGASVFRQMTATFPQKLQET